MDSKIGIIGKRYNTLPSDYIVDLPEVYIEPIEPKFDFNIDYLKDAKIYYSTVKKVTIETEILGMKKKEETNGF